MSALQVALTVVVVVAIWFTADVIRWHLGETQLPYSHADYIINALSHVWATQITVAIILGLFYPLNFQIKERLWNGLWFRNFALAIVGGFMGSFFFPPFSWWVVPGLAIFGLLQISIAGTLIGTFLRKEVETT